MVEEQLVAFAGTILVVSHDRVFLDHLVTSTMVLEGDGKVGEFVGGYEDWLRQRAGKTGTTGTTSTNRSNANVAAGLQSGGGSKSAKLSYKEKREFEELPSRIAALEGERDGLRARIAGPEFYKEGADAITAAMARLDAVGVEIETAYARWDDLDSRRS